jgi:hypothetical protein
MFCVVFGATGSVREALFYTIAPCLSFGAGFFCSLCCLQHLLEDGYQPEGYVQRQPLPAPPRFSQKALRSIGTVCTLRQWQDSLPPESPKVVLSESAACAVCLLELGPDDLVRGLRQCGHAFHRDCLDGWFDSASTSALLPTCPLCRAPCFGDKPFSLSTADIQLSIDDDGETLPAAGGELENPELVVGDHVVSNSRERIYQI